MDEYDRMKQEIESLKAENKKLLGISRMAAWQINNRDRIIHVDNMTKVLPTAINSGDIKIADYENFIYAEDLPKMKEWFEKHLNGEEFDNQITFRRINGSQLDVMKFAITQKTKRDEVLYFKGVIQHINANDQANITARFFRNMMDNSDEDIACTDLYGNVIFANESIRKHIGWDKHQIKQINLFDEGGRKGQNWLTLNYQTLLGQTYVKNAPYKNYPDIKSCEYHLYETTNENDTINIWVIGRNVTDFQYFKKEQIEARKHAEEANHMKSLFLANMSHEIRTPLNAINGFSKIIAYEENPEERLHYMEIIESNSSRLLSLIDDILDLSKIESGKMNFKINPMNVHDMLHEVYNIQRFRCGDLRLDVQEGNESLYIQCDRNRLIQVLSNLIGNAIKHTETGSIQVKYTKEDAMLHFTVKDTGHGIAPEMLEDIFKEYVMATDTVQGTGLGLALCKNIVETLGGKIWVESVVNQGSTFHFTIPCNETDRHEGAHEILKDVRTEKVAENKKHRILIAEDNASNRELMKALMGRTYDIIWATDGIEAVTKNEEEQPELILMDIQMPNMDGLEATRIIKEVNPNTPILACSAYAFEADIKKAKDAGCSDFITKPVKSKDLKEKLSKYLK